MLNTGAVPVYDTAEHQAVQRETKKLRNTLARQRRRAHARAQAWCEALGATVTMKLLGDLGPLYTVRVPGFHPATARTLPDAVAHLERTVAAWCAGPSTHGPTGAALDPIRARLKAYRLTGGDVAP
jgi:hypothetical protein